MQPQLIPHQFRQNCTKLQDPALMKTASGQLGCAKKEPVVPWVRQDYPTMKIERSMKKKIYVANWKLFLSGAQTRAWCVAHAGGLCDLSAQAKIIVCPEFVFLEDVRELLDPAIGVGGQNCSAHIAGARTGEVSPASLCAVGATYCIVGHSEARANACESPRIVADKVVGLCEYGLTPILCVGEKIDEQLAPVVSRLANLEKCPQELMIAYEPEWAIGGNDIPAHEHLVKACVAIRELVSASMPDLKIALLYGGSVSEKTAEKLAASGAFDGYLIGRASTDFQTFKNIVVLS
jgi:triosephosphate isomerase (TIM)